MPHAYTEDQLVEQPAIGLFAELGWQTVSAGDEVFGSTGTLQRETSGEVVLAFRLRAALERLNPDLPTEAISAAMDELARDRSAMSLVAANREVYLLLKEGIALSVSENDGGGQEPGRLNVIDWDDPANNDFLLVSQFSVTALSLLPVAPLEPFDDPPQPAAITPMAPTAPPITLVVPRRFRMVELFSSSLR